MGSGQVPAERDELGYGENQGNTKDDAIFGDQPAEPASEPGCRAEEAHHDGAR
jgi:hypothetical protein